VPYVIQFVHVVLQCFDVSTILWNVYNIHKHIYIYVLCICVHCTSVSWIKQDYGLYTCNILSQSVNSYRSKDGNAGGMSFSSGNGKGFAFGGTFNGRNNGEFVMSQNSPGTIHKHIYIYVLCICVHCTSVSWIKQDYGLYTCNILSQSRDIILDTMTGTLSAYVGSIQLLPLRR
jgi:hypothetical protein